MKKEHSARFEDGEFTFRVSPISLDDYEAVIDLRDAAIESFRGANLRALIDRFVAVAAPEVDGAPITAEWFGPKDSALILSLVRQWDVGVRGVPLPLPLAPSDTTASEATPPQS